MAAEEDGSLSFCLETDRCVFAWFELCWLNGDFAEMLR